jgi:hypothetical protein
VPRSRPSRRPRGRSRRRFPPRLGQPPTAHSHQRELRVRPGDTDRPVLPASVPARGAGRDPWGRRRGLGVAVRRRVRRRPRVPRRGDRHRRRQPTGDHDRRSRAAGSLPAATFDCLLVIQTCSTRARRAGRSQLPQRPASGGSLLIAVPALTRTTDHDAARPRLLAVLARWRRERCSGRLAPEARTRSPGTGTWWQRHRCSTAWLRRNSSDRSSSTATPTSRSSCARGSTSRAVSRRERRGPGRYAALMQAAGDVGQARRGPDVVVPRRDGGGPLAAARGRGWRCSGTGSGPEGPSPTRPCDRWRTVTLADQLDLLLQLGDVVPAGRARASAARQPTRFALTFDDDDAGHASTRCRCCVDRGVARHLLPVRALAHRRWAVLVGAARGRGPDRRVPGRGDPTASPPDADAPRIAAELTGTPEVDALSSRRRAPPGGSPMSRADRRQLVARAWRSASTPSTTPRCRPARHGDLRAVDPRRTGRARGGSRDAGGAVRVPSRPRRRTVAVER